MTDIRSQAASLLRMLGIPGAAGELYLLLLDNGALRLTELSATLGLTPPALTQAIEYLKIFRLISQDLNDNEVVLFASNPKNAWKAHDADFYWARSLHIGDIERLPSLPEMRDEERRRCYSQLERLCGTIYDQNAKAHDPLRHRHRDIHSAELFSAWLATVIAAATKEILAVELPPRLPDLAPIWVALTRQIRSGAQYTRIVGKDEIIEHGLDIVTRDIEQYGIRLRIVPESLIADAFYLVDKKHLLLKNLKSHSPRGNTHFGTYTSHNAIVRRYKKRFHEHYMPASTDARLTIERLREKAEHQRAFLQTQSRRREADLFSSISAFGKFAGVSNADAEDVAYLLGHNFITRNAAGHLVMTIGHDIEETP